MIILGIDPGWDRCGWAKLRVAQGSNARRSEKPELLECGVITTERGRPRTERLTDLYGQACRLFRKAPRPQHVAVEEIHLPPQGYRISNLLHLGEARGVLMLAAGQTGLAISEIHPLTVKSAVTGSARSSKQDVARFLKFLVGSVPSGQLDDTTDAVAIALTAALSVKSPLLASVS